MPELSQTRGEHAWHDRSLLPFPVQFAYLYSRSSPDLWDPWICIIVISHLSIATRRTITPPPSLVRRGPDVIIGTNPPPSSMSNIHDAGRDNGSSPHDPSNLHV